MVYQIVPNTNIWSFLLFFFVVYFDRVEYYFTTRAWDKKVVGGPLAARYRVEQNIQESSLG